MANNQWYQQVHMCRVSLGVIIQVHDGLRRLKTNNNYAVDTPYDKHQVQIHVLQN